MSNVLFVIVGPSGAGKTHVMRSIMSSELRSLTTRSPRKGETDRDYAWVTKSTFEGLLRRGELLEYTEYSGNFYGLSKSEVDSKLNEKDSFVIVDREGMRQLNAYYNNCVNILLYADKRDCMINMLDRGDGIEKVESRLSTYEEETTNTDIFDYVVKNIRHNKEYTERAITEIIMSERNKSRRQQ